MRAEGLKKVKGELAFSTAQLAEQHSLNQQLRAISFRLDQQRQDAYEQQR